MSRLTSVSDIDVDQATDLLPFVDTHVHFWELQNPNLNYDILETTARHPLIGDIDGLRVNRFSVEEYRAQSRFQNVSKVVHVQVAFGTPDPLIETAWLEELAEGSGRPDAIVSSADLSSDDAREVLDGLAGFPRVRGLRGTGSVSEMMSAAWRRGYAALQEHGYSFAHPFGVGSFEVAANLALDFPDTTLIVDQAGMPLQRDAEYYRSWRDGLDVAAGAPNTVCKISSLGMIDQRWTIASLRPWILGCIDAFGPDRCFFGSNFPMDSVASSFPDLINAFRTVISEFSQEDQAAMLSENATRVYRLGGVE